MRGSTITAAIAVVLQVHAGTAAEPEHAYSGKRSPATVSLNEQQQKVLIERTVMLHNQLPTPPEFKPALHAEVPKAVQLSAFPGHITTDLPVLKEFWYAHLDRSIVLVDGLSLKVAGLVPLPEHLYATKLPNAQQAALNWAGGLPDFSKEQKQELYAALAAPAETTGSATSIPGSQPIPQGIVLRAGVELPSDTQVSPLPDPIRSKLQAFSESSFAKLQDGRIVITDPQRRIVGVITRAEGSTGQPAAGSRDPLRNLEETQNHPSAYTGPGTKR